MRNIFQAALHHVLSCEKSTHQKQQRTRHKLSRWVLLALLCFQVSPSDAGVTVTCGDVSSSYLGSTLRCRGLASFVQICWNSAHSLLIFRQLLLLFFVVDCVLSNSISVWIFGINFSGLQATT